jgi:hypothetical protein
VLHPRTSGFTLRLRRRYVGAFYCRSCGLHSAEYPQDLAGRAAVISGTARKQAGKKSVESDDASDSAPKRGRAQTKLGVATSGDKKEPAATRGSPTVTEVPAKCVFLLTHRTLPQEAVAAEERRTTTPAGDAPAPELEVFSLISVRRY